jgi:hypothetical protein
VVRGYAEGQLITNRVSVLLCGGAENDRKAWALEAAGAFPDEGALVEAADGTSLAQTFSLRQGVVYVADATALSWASQRELTRLLREREERPKFVLGASQSLASLAQRGLLRDDLLFALSRATLDLNSAEVKDAISRRRKAKKGH